MMTADPDSTDDVMSRAVCNESTPEHMSGTEMVALNSISGGAKSRKKGTNKQSLREGTRVMKMIALLALSILTVAAALTWMQFHQGKSLVSNDEISGGDASAGHISEKNTVEALLEDGSAATRNPTTGAPQQEKKGKEEAAKKAAAKKPKKDAEMAKASGIPAGQPVDHKQKQQTTQQTIQNPNQKRHGPSKPKDGELEKAPAQPKLAQPTETPGTGAQRIPFPESNQKPPVTEKQDLNNEIMKKPNNNSTGQATQVSATPPAKVVAPPVPENMPQEPKVLNKWNEKQMKMTGKRNDDQSGKILKDNQANEEEQQEERKYKNSPPSQARGNPRPLQPNLDGKPQKLGVGSETIAPTTGQSLGNPLSLQPNRDGKPQKFGMGRRQTIAPTTGQSLGNPSPLQQPNRDGTTQKIGMGSIAPTVNANAAGASNKASVNVGTMQRKRHNGMMMNGNKNVPDATSGMVWKQKPNASEEIIPEQHSTAPPNGEYQGTTGIVGQQKSNTGQAPEEVLSEQHSTAPANGFFDSFWKFASSIAPGIPEKTQEGVPESPQQEQQLPPSALRKQPVDRPVITTNTNTTSTAKKNNNN